MLIEFDQNTIANMTAALELVCNRLPTDKDRPETRKQIADAMIACARSGKQSFPDLQEAGFQVLKRITQPSGFLEFAFKWLRLKSSHSFGGKS